MPFFKVERIVKEREENVMERIITKELLDKYREYLREEDKSTATINKYICDLGKLMDYAAGREITKKLMVEYKEDLRVKKQYKLTSINSFLVAANRLFEYLGWYELKIKTYRIQKEVFVPESRDLSRKDYRALVKAAKRKGKKRLAMIIQTICATGIRIGELANITVESVKKGIAEIYCKGKQRKVLFPKKLQKLLMRYISENNILSGVVFCTRSGRAVDRSNVWKEMKALGEEAGLTGEKIFPHNLRHLFAKAFYEVDKDIAKLADVLGHSSIETTRIYIMTNDKRGAPEAAGYDGTGVRKHFFVVLNYEHNNFILKKYSAGWKICKF